MLRDEFSDALKTAMKNREALRVGTVRLILARLKEQDIEARGKGRTQGLDDAQIQQMLQGMIKQRQESITLYQQGNRPDLVAKEEGEIAIITGFLPEQMTETEADAAIRDLIAETGATTIKDMGKVMAALRERLAGRIDGAKASAIVKKLLGAS
jgi:uncharacterized protein